MIVFPAVAAATALLCAGIVGWDAAKRPRPERVAWAVAFLLFAVAAGTEVVGATVGWSPTLARVYYLAGAVLVVGILALGELYLLVPGRMPTFTLGFSLLVVAVAATAVWSAPIAAARLETDGWRAIERGPFLIALAATINAGGTVVLAGGATYSAFKLKAAAGAGRRAAGCALIAIGTVVVALGGTLTRFGQPEFLYVAMSIGIVVIFAGVLLTRRSGPRVIASTISAVSLQDAEPGLWRPRLIPLPARPHPESPLANGEGIQYVTDNLLPLDDEAIAETCRRWSATAITGDALSRDQARRTWALRLQLPDMARERFDRLPLPLQAQLAELFAEVWSEKATGGRREVGA